MRWSPLGSSGAVFLEIEFTVLEFQVMFEKGSYQSDNTVLAIVTAETLSFSKKQGPEKLSSVIAHCRVIAV